MLPEILRVAEEYGLTFNPRYHGKKETLCKCTFCEEDAKPGKGNKFYLSLNTQDQVYKCWYCGVSGGVLDFEAKLSGLPYNEVREKYFALMEPLRKVVEIPAERIWQRLGLVMVKHRRAVPPARVPADLDEPRAKHHAKKHPAHEPHHRHGSPAPGGAHENRE